ncbi:MAG: molybdenum cofactor biosynthesis protein MoaE [Lachnospiraceae bacterium]|nr:molybdenum cofactor biosynthesis protein MoaE [Lachnospiraceae bacterium]
MDYRAAVITVSDKGFRGEREDTSGPALCKMLEEAGYEVCYTKIVPDEKEQIRQELLYCADEMQFSLVLTTGGTGFSPRDITPEATLSAVERLTPGIPEAMRAESMKITPHGCLSRETAGIRGRTLIINLPGSKKASTENLAAVLKPIRHGLEMLFSEGSSDGVHGHDDGVHRHDEGHKAPSMDDWIREAKEDPDASKIGMYLTHCGVVRETARAKVRRGDDNAPAVQGMLFSYDAEKLQTVIEEAKGLEGIYYIRVWLNEGRLRVGNDIMRVLVGGDIRPHVISALEHLVGRIKNECVSEKEL